MQHKVIVCSSLPAGILLAGSVGFGTPVVIGAARVCGNVRHRWEREHVLRVKAVDQSELNAGVMQDAGDWASLGRLVRRRTLEAVALHFATIAEMPSCGTSDGDSQPLIVECQP